MEILLISNKYVLNGFIKQPAFEFDSHGIKVNAMSSGFIDSPMTEGVEEECVYKAPSDRPGKLEEVAKLALFLASDVSNYMNGTNVFMDGGGWTLGGQ